MEVVRLHPGSGVRDYQQAVQLARGEAEGRFAEYMLVSWYDRDRDFESPPHTSECSAGGAKDGYVHYGLNHGATLKVDIEEGRFVFFFAPVEW
ncbi:MAG: hypothetical protein A2521_07005 [Deltaproteobacteria bacterium RIFOXYD12_FULL_57_12]|nr:MAG: hypothetical protein A2521_07005 [Deltaproteobacteria bacterium RIFOXYD12_FULL_57_12]